MEHSHNFNRARDLAIGFFVWLLLWNILFLIFLFSYSMSLWFIGIAMIIGIGLPFLCKRNWLGYGVLACVITNMVVWITIAIAISYFQIIMLITPFPVGLLFIME